MVYETKHVRDKWADDRPATCDRSVMWGWTRGVPVDYVTSFFTNSDGEEADEVRVYHGVTAGGDQYKMLILRCDDALVTTYEYNGVSDSRVEAYLDKMFERFLVYE